MDEYISKQSVLDYLNGYLHSLGEGGADDSLFDRGQRRALTNAIQDILVAKAADVQSVNHARWIWSNSPEFGNPYGSYICSECESLQAYRENYCPNCGARMDGDTNV